jgi:hypothetical protein
MRIQSLTRHAGVSFNGGPGFVHIRTANADPRVLRSAWDTVVAQRGLGEPLQVTTSEDDGSGRVDGFAPVFPFLPLPSLATAIRAAYADRAISKTLTDELALASADARMFEASYGMHLREAQRRGWVAQSFRLGFYPAILVGAGRHAHMLVMNMPARASAPLALAGMNKGIARDLLAAHGLPIAAGALAASPTAALRAARRIGGLVVIKRLIGGNSDGVIVGLSETRDITSAAKMLLAGNHAVLVESAVTGVELRLHFLSGKLHRTFRAEPYSVTGDGKRSLAELIGERYPRYLHIMSGSNAHRRRLVMCLWAHGVRTIADVEKVIPELGRAIRISAATGAGMERVEVTDFIPKRDISRIERFLKSHGSPSGGIDVIVCMPGAPFDEGGVILELNIPCGFAYLDDPQRAVATDLDAAIAGDATFRRDKGRVPVWLVMKEDGEKVARRVELALRKQHEHVVVNELTAHQSNWVSLLNRPDADALLVTVSEDAILAHGIPVNLAPVLVFDGDPKMSARKFPITWQTVRHAKGRHARSPFAPNRQRAPKSGIG